MNVTEALLTRKSVRAFLDQNVTHEQIIKILNHAKQAPSGTNTQPWQVAVVSGNKKSELDNSLLDAFNNNIPRTMDYNYYPDVLSPELKVRRLACGLQMFKTLNIAREDKEKRAYQWGLNYSAFGAPVVLYFFADKFIDKGSYIDMGMFMQSVMLMACELGLATCAQASLAEYADIVKDLLGYPKDLILLCGMAIGYEDVTAPINSYRTPREEVLSFTKFFE
jgi:nitroreductase